MLLWQFNQLKWFGWLLVFTCWYAPAQLLSSAVDFQLDVRPILSNHCFQCHGPDESARMADLRLDVQKGVFSKQPSCRKFMNQTKK